MIYYIYSIVLKYSRTSCLHAPFLGVLGFHTLFSSNISSIFFTFTTRKKLFIPFDVYFYHLVIPCFYSLNNPTTPHEPIIINLIQIIKNIPIMYPFLNFSLASSPHSCTQPRPISPSTPHFIVLPMLLISIGCQFLLVLINIHQRHP